MRYLGPALIGSLAACQPLSTLSNTEPQALLPGSIPGRASTGGFESAIVFAGTRTTAHDCGWPELEIFGRLFRMTPLFFAASGAPRGRLAAYCRLQLIDDPMNLGWPSLERLQQALTDLFEDATARIGPDHVGLAQTPPHPGPVVDLTWEGHWTRFMQQVGAFRTEELPREAAPRIALVDSAPTASSPGWTANRPRADYLDHGLALARIAEELLCAEGDAQGECLAEIVSEQAMKRTPRGLQGTLGDLARAIVKVVDEAPEPHALSINLSLGWINPAMGGDFGDIFVDPREEPAAAAVHEALQYARCRGAAVFAAAGNRVGAFDGLESGLIRPAHWSQVDSQETDCKTEFGLGGVVQGRLVTAVGAVTESDVPLAVSRWGAEPPLVAPGVFAVARTEAGVMTPTALLSGTSVASLIAAVQTAVLQHVRPSDPVQRIEADLSLTARPLGRPAETGPGSVHALHLLSSVAAAPRFPAAAPLVFPSVPGAIEVTAAPGTWILCTVAGVHVPVFGNPDDVECPQLGWESVDELPYTHPQPIPSGGGCPGCAMRFSISSLLLDVPSGTEYSPAFLEVIDDAGIYHLALPKELEAGQVYEVNLALPPPPAPSPRARVIFANPAMGSLTATEILVWN